MSDCLEIISHSYSCPQQAVIGLLMTSQIRIPTPSGCNCRLSCSLMGSSVGYLHSLSAIHPFHYSVREKNMGNWHLPCAARVSKLNLKAFCCTFTSWTSQDLDLICMLDRPLSVGEWPLPFIQSDGCPNIADCREECGLRESTPGTFSFLGCDD